MPLVLDAAVKNRLYFNASLRGVIISEKNVNFSLWLFFVSVFLPLLMRQKLYANDTI